MESKVASETAMARMDAQAPFASGWDRLNRKGGPRQQSSPSSILSEQGSAEKRAEEESSSYPSRATHKASSLYPNSSMQAIESGAHHHTSESSAAYFHWPPTSRLHGTAEERAAYFSGLQKDILLHAHAHDVHERSESDDDGMPQQASTLLDLMTIRAFHSKLLRQFSLGTAIGFRNRNGMLTDIPAIIVFVARKVDKEWLHELQLLPPVLEGPGGIWCDVDVVEFSYYGTPAIAPQEQVYTQLVEALRGNDSCIGPGSQVASQETYGTLGAIVQSRTGMRQVGFLTNRHVAVDLDYPNQKMFHPLPPNLGPGIYLGAVERATSFITDDLWYGIFASMNPETFVRADGAFIPFSDHFDMSRVTTTVNGVGDMGEVMVIDLQAPVGSIVGREVIKVGRSSGLTMGSIMAYALEYNDEKGICFFTDFLIVGDGRQAFDLEGDSGSLILLKEGDGEKPRPVGIIWGGTANRGRLKLRNGYGPENWTSGVDLGRLLDLLQLSLITRNDRLADVVQEQRQRLFAGSRGVGARRGGSGGILQEERGETSEQATLREASNLQTTTTTSTFAHQHQQLPVTTLIDSNPSASKPLVRELELLDFSFAMQDGSSQVAELENKKLSTTEEASTSLQLFDRHGKKRPSSGS